MGDESDPATTVAEVSVQTLTTPSSLPRVVHDSSALVLLVDLGSGDVVYANRLAEQIAPGLLLPLPLRDWAEAANLRDVPGQRDDGPAGAIRRVLAGEGVSGQLVTAARASDSAPAREPLWFVGLPLDGAPAPLGSQALVVFLPLHGHETRPDVDGTELHSRAVLATELSFSISDALAPDDPLIWVNPAFERTTGYRAEEVIGRNCRFLQGPESDRATVDRLRAAIRAAEPATVTLLNHRADGTAFWNEISLSPVFDGRGRCTHFVGVQADVTAKVEADRDRDDAYATAARALASERQARTEAEQAQQQLLLQAEATSLLAQTLDVREALTRLTGLLVPLLADWVAVNLVDDDGTIQIAATHHRDGQQELLARWAALQQTTLTPDSPVRHALATGEVVVRNGLTPEQAQAHTTDPEAVEVAERLGLRSVLYVPLVARRRTLGVMTLVSGSSRRDFGPAETGLAADLGRRAAITMDNNRLYAAEHETALTLQRSLLPSVPEVDGLDVAALYLPGSDRAEVGGDWYDVLPLPDGATGLAIGDVMGHDLAAATAMGQLRSVLRSYAWEGDAPAVVLDKLDRLVQGLEMAQLATTLYARLELGGEGGVLTYANAGHHAPMLRTPDGAVRRLDDTEGALIGLPIEATDRRTDATVAVPRGSVLLLFTDGLVESRTRDLDVGIAEVAEVLARHDPAAGADALADALAALATRHDADDDVCILAVQVR